MATPPGISAGDFSAALERFSNIVGKAWVFTSDEDLGPYRDGYSPIRGEADERVASAAVAPSSVEEVQEIVRTANRYRIPLYPISTGRNLTYGGAAPVYSGSVILDLKRMNRILEIDERGAYCMVEPGVSFFDLYRHIRDNKLKLRMSQPDPGWGSPIGNALEHGVGRHFYRDHFKSHSGMEVVLPNGEVLRTGMGALPNSASLWPRFPYGYGPSVDGIFSQSNFGIVTKMGFHMLPEPELTRIAEMSISRFEDLDAFVDEIARLHDLRVLDSNSELAVPLLSTQLPEARALLETTGGGSSKEWNELGARLGIAPWRLNVPLMGPAKIVESHFDHVVERLSRFAGFKVGRVRNYPAAPDPDEVASEDKCLMGIPSLQSFTGIATSRGGGHLDFSPVFPMTGEAIRKVNALRKQAMKEGGLPWTGWRGGNTWFPKTFVMIDGFRLSSDDLAKNRQLVDVFRNLVTLFAANGLAEYRTHAVFHDLLAEQYSYNDHALLRFNEMLKDTIDPNGVLAAGRCGIWPKHLRKDRA